MPTQVPLPDDLAARIDRISNDRASFVADAVRRVLHEKQSSDTTREVEKINRVVDELNREAAEVLGFQVIP